MCCGTEKNDERRQRAYVRVAFVRGGPFPPSTLYSPLSCQQDDCLFASPGQTYSTGAAKSTLPENKSERLSFPGLSFHTAQRVYARR